MERDNPSERAGQTERETIGPSDTLSRSTGLSVPASRHRSIFISPYLWCFALLLGALVLSAAIGAVTIPALDVIRILLSRLPFIHFTPDWPATSETILFDIRLPRTILMALTGAALSGSGAASQGLFLN